VTRDEAGSSLFDSPQAKSFKPPEHLAEFGVLLSHQLMRLPSMFRVFDLKSLALAAYVAALSVPALAQTGGAAGTGFGGSAATGTDSGTGTGTSGAPGAGGGAGLSSGGTSGTNVGVGTPAGGGLSTGTVGGTNSSTVGGAGSSNDLSSTRESGNTKCPVGQTATRATPPAGGNVSCQ
jgi:hypothetical protein